MNIPHKHAALIKVWADGAEIEYYDRDGMWTPTDRPRWFEEVEYRVKPVPWRHPKWHKEIEAYTLHNKVVEWLVNGVWKVFIDPRQGYFVGHKPELKQYAQAFDDPTNQFRIQPETVVKYANVYDLNFGNMQLKENWYHNKNAPTYRGALKLTFEDGVLVAAEVLKK